jgi:hypothetical protein
MNRALLAFRGREGVEMLILKTHFEQVSLTIVRKMVEEQIRLETTTKQNQKAKHKPLEHPLERHPRSMVRQRAVPIEES